MPSTASKPAASIHPACGRNHTARKAVRAWAGAIPGVRRRLHGQLRVCGNESPGYVLEMHTVRAGLQFNMPDRGSGIKGLIELCQTLPHVGGAHAYNRILVRIVGRLSAKNLVTDNPFPQCCVVAVQRMLHNIAQ